MGIAWFVVAGRCATHRVFPLWIGVLAGLSGLGGLLTGLLAIATSTKPPAVLDGGSFPLACVVMSSISISSLRNPSQ